MKEFEFCYWLQGYFEIAKSRGEEIKLTEAGLECINRHLGLVRIHEGHLGSFTAWLQGVIDAGAGMNDNGEVSADVIDKITTQLGSMFKHEIDPSYPSNQQSQLSQTHNPGFSNPNVLLKC